MTASDETQIRALIERWAQAVHAGDLTAVLEGHAADIVMFDVPPPHDGVRGLAAYERTWPPFFEWQAAGARFDLLELDVTAGADVAFALRAAVVREGGGARGDARAPAPAHLRAAQGVRPLGGRPRAPFVRVGVRRARSPGGRAECSGAGRGERSGAGRSAPCRGGRGERSAPTPGRGGEWDRRCRHGEASTSGSRSVRAGARHPARRFPARARGARGLVRGVVAARG